MTKNLIPFFADLSSGLLSWRYMHFRFSGHKEEQSPWAYQRSVSTISRTLITLFSYRLRHVLTNSFFSIDILGAGNIGSLVGSALASLPTATPNVSFILRNTERLRDYLQYGSQVTIKRLVVGTNSYTEVVREISRRCKAAARVRS